MAEAVPGVCGWCDASHAFALTRATILEDLADWVHREDPPIPLAITVGKPREPA
jgi:hypothetical protein